jgi:exodeoxyribonuclease VII small subunit
MAKKKEIASEELSYELAFHELQNIIASIENDSVSIDELALKVKRAGELVQFCRLKLRAAENEINTLVSQMNDESRLNLE